MPVPPAASIHSHSLCRVCAASLDTVWDLGSQTVVAFPQLGDRLTRAPLEVVRCTDPECGLVQLRHTVPAEQLFAEYYWYRSSTNELMVQALADVVDQALVRQPICPTDWVMDIGANDGTLLAHYKAKYRHERRIAFEPAKNLHEALWQNCEILEPHFFPAPPQPKVHPKIITACACAYDLEHPLEFFQGIQEWLAPHGLFVLQLGYLGDLFSQNAFDSICHEHLEYYSLTSLVYVLACAGLTVVDVQQNDVNGGSIRCYVRRSVDPEAGDFSRTVFRMLNEEAALGFTRADPWPHLKLRVGKVQAKVLDTIDAAQKHGPVDIYGASTKGLTLCSTWGLDWTRIRYAADRSPFKVGRYYGSTGIPIVSEESWRKGKGVLAVVLPWHFQLGIVAREAHWLWEGGKMLFPLPNGEVLGGVQ